MIFKMFCKHDCCDDEYISISNNFQASYTDLHYKSITQKNSSYNTLVSQCIRYHGGIEAFEFEQLSDSSNIDLKILLIHLHKPSLNIQYNVQKANVGPSKSLLKDINKFIDAEKSKYANEMIELISDKKYIEQLYIK